VASFSELVPAALVLTGAIGLGACSEPPRSALIVTVDTLRADHLPLYGAEGIAAPALERLGSRGVVFERALSTASVTAPSHASILTGRYPSHHTIGLTNGIFRLDERTPTLATVLKARGYATGAVVSNPVLQSALGLARGFDSYDDRLEGSEAVRRTPERYADRAVDLALEWFEAHPAVPFFFWLHLQDPHGPYVPRDEASCSAAAADDPRVLPVGSDPSGDGAIPDYQALGEERRAAEYVRRYDCEIEFTDRQLGRLLDRLERDGRLGETLVIFVADHGEAMGEDGFWFAHGHSAGLDQVHVPLVLAGPGLPQGRRVDRPVSTAWIVATVLDALGVELPEGAEPVSLLPLARGDEVEAPAVFVETGPQSAVAWAGAYLRRDRRPATDADFWSGNGWRPLGSELIGFPGAGEPVLSGPPGAAQLGLLDPFDRRAAASRRRLDAFHHRIDYNEEELRTLRSLGYLH